jgi:chaperonin cofactor prefoldin
MDERQKQWRNEEEALVERERAAFKRWQTAHSALPKISSDKKAMEKALQETKEALREFEAAKAENQRVVAEFEHGRRY